MEHDDDVGAFGQRQRIAGLLVRAVAAVFRMAVRDDAEPPRNLPSRERPNAMNDSIEDSPLAAALRTHAAGLYPAEAAGELLIGNATWLLRRDFTTGFVHLSTADETAMAYIDWPDAIAALDSGQLPCSGGEGRILRIAASIADGIPVDLRDALTGLDNGNAHLFVRALLHATGLRPSISSAESR
jgi:hypothetical protein